MDAEVDWRLWVRRDGDPTDTGLAVSKIRVEGPVDLVANGMRHASDGTSVPDRYRTAYA